MAKADKSVLGFKLNEVVLAVIDQRKAGRFSSSKGCAHAKDHDVFRLRVEVFCDLGTNVILGQVRLIRVNHVHNALLTGEQRIANELSELNGCGFRHFKFCTHVGRGDIYCKYLGYVY